MAFDPELRIPWGYGQTYKRLDDVRVILLVHYHPEYVRRLLAWLTSKGGEVGIGGTWRATGTQPDKPGFAEEGKSFHQDQKYADGFVGACAVDLVAKDGPDADASHDGVTWAMVPRQGSAAAKTWGVHCNIDSEAWHIQPVEIDGWASWVAAGRPAPKANYPLPEPPEVPMGLNWNQTDAVLATVKSAPPTAEVLAGKWDDWWAVSTIKALQALTGLPVTGRWNQATGEAVNAEMAKRGIRL